MTRLVLDTSAVVAAWGEEPGAAVVAEAVARGGAVVSAVNATEVGVVLTRFGAEPGEAASFLLQIGTPVVPYGPAEAEVAAPVAARYRGRISLGDAACVATARVLGRPVLTGDRSWATLDLGVEVRLIR